MARATFVKRAQKDILNFDGTVKIAKGESYWWWKFRHGGKITSKEAPKPSQLTQSSFLSTLYGIQERIAELPADDSLPSNVEEIVSDLRELADECEEKRENMPESLQDSDTGNMLEERAQACNDAADELEEIDLEDFEPADEQTCPECEGDGKIEDDHGKEIDCPMCNGTGTVSKDHEAIDDPVNDDGNTESDYWQSKLEEVQNVSVDAP